MDLDPNLALVVSSIAIPMGIIAAMKVFSSGRE